MQKPIRAIVPLALLVALALPASGCGSKTRTAAAVAAGTVGAIVLTNQNAEAEFQGSVGEWDRRTRAVLADLGLEITKSSSERGGLEREYEARSGDRVVHTKVEQLEAGTTKVSVSSRRGTTLDYDVSHARMVLERIQQRS